MLFTKDQTVYAVTSGHYVKGKVAGITGQKLHIRIEVVAELHAMSPILLPDSIFPVEVQYCFDNQRSAREKAFSVYSQHLRRMERLGVFLDQSLIPVWEKGAQA